MIKKSIHSNNNKDGGAAAAASVMAMDGEFLQRRKVAIQYIYNDGEQLAPSASEAEGEHRGDTLSFFRYQRRVDGSCSLPSQGAVLGNIDQEPIVMGRIPLDPEMWPNEITLRYSTDPDKSPAAVATKTFNLSIDDGRWTRRTLALLVSNVVYSSGDSNNQPPAAATGKEIYLLDRLEYDSKSRVWDVIVRRVVIN